MAEVFDSLALWDAETIRLYHHAEKEYADRNVIIDSKHTISTQTSFITTSPIRTVTSDKHGVDENTANKETETGQNPSSIDLKSVEQLVKNTYEELIKFKDEFQHRSDLPKPSEATDPSNKLSPIRAKLLPENENKTDGVSKAQKKTGICDKKPSLIRNTTVNRTFLLRRTLSEKSTDVKHTSSINQLDTKKVIGPKGSKGTKTLVGRKKPLQSTKTSQEIYGEDHDDQIDFVNINKSRITFQDEDEKMKENVIDVARIDTPSEVSLDQDDIQIDGKSNHSSVQKPGLPEETPKSIASKKDVQKLIFVNFNDTFSIEPDIEIASNLPSPMKTQISSEKPTSEVNLVTTGTQCSNLDETMVNQNKLTVQMLPKIDIKRALVTQKIPNLIIEPVDSVVDTVKPDNIGYMEIIHGSARLSTVATQIDTLQELSEHHEVNTTVYKDLPETSRKNVLPMEENILNLRSDMKTFESDNEEHKNEQVNTNNVSIFKQNQGVLENRCAEIKKRLEAMRQHKFQRTLDQNITENHATGLQDTMLTDTDNQKSHDKPKNEGNSSPMREENIERRKSLKEMQSRLESQCATIKTRLAEQRKINFADALNLRRELTLPPRWQTISNNPRVKSVATSPKRERISKNLENSKEEEHNSAISSEKAESYTTSSAFMSDHSIDTSSTSEKIQPVKLKELTSNLSSSGKEKDTRPALKESEIILEKLLQKHDKQVADQVIQTDRTLVTDQNTQYSLRSSSTTDVTVSEDKILENITSTRFNKQQIVENVTSITSTKVKGDKAIAELEKAREINVKQLENEKKSDENLEFDLELNKTEFSSEKPGVLKLSKLSKGKKVHFETVTSQFCISPDEKLAEDFKNKDNYALEGTSQEIKAKGTGIKQTMVTEDELQKYSTEYNGTDRSRKMIASRNLNVSNTHGVKEMKDTSIQCSPPQPEQQTHPESNVTQSNTVPVDKAQTGYEQDLTGPRASSYLKLLDSYKMQTLNTARFTKEKVYSKYKKSSTPLVSTDTATTDNDTDGTSLSEGEVKLPCSCSTSIGEIHLCRFANDIKRRTKMKQNPETLIKENVPCGSDSKQYDHWLAYMSKSENTISGDTNSYISSITSNYTSETGS